MPYRAAATETRAHARWRVRLVFIGFVLGCLPTTGRAQGTFTIDKLQYFGSTAAIEFTDSRPGNTAGTYLLETSGVLDTTILWASPPGATFSSLGGTKRLVTFPAVTGARFFRIRETGTDTDGDGIPDAREQAIGSNPFDADTDADGFGDGIEVGYGSDPLNVTNRPPASLLPAITFVSDLVTVNEAAGTYLAQINFSAPYSGTVQYSIGVSSTATSQGASPDFLPVNGTVQVNGTSASIPIGIIDDLLVRGTRIIHLDLKTDVAGRYRRGAVIRQIIRLEDNDNYWTGILKDVYSYTNSLGAVTNAGGYGELSFRLKLLRQGASFQATLVSSNDNSSGRGVGTIPAGDWPMQTFSLNANSLHAASAPIPIPSTPLFPNASLSRTFRFTASPTNRLAYGMSARRIVGDFQEEVAATEPRSQHLVRNGTRGIFILLEDLPQ